MKILIFFLAGYIIGFILALNAGQLIGFEKGKEFCKTYILKGKQNVKS